MYLEQFGSGKEVFLILLYFMDYEPRFVCFSVNGANSSKHDGHSQVHRRRVSINFGPRFFTVKFRPTRSRSSAVGLSAGSWTIQQVTNKSSNLCSQHFWKATMPEMVTVEEEKIVEVEKEEEEEESSGKGPDED